MFSSLKSPAVEKETKAKQLARINRPFKSPVVNGPNTGQSPVVTNANRRNSNKRILYQSPLSQPSGLKSSSSSNNGDVCNPPMKRTKLSSVLHTKNKPAKSIEELCQHEAELDREIASLQSEGFVIEELDRQIDLLHRYNDVKDAAQMVMGRLAELEGRTVKSLHGKYDAPLCS